MAKYFKKELGRREFFKKVVTAGTLAVLTPSVLTSTSKEAEKLPEKEVKPEPVDITYIPAGGFWLELQS